MLTNSDFLKIKTIVKDEVDPLKADVKGLKGDVKQLEVDVRGLKGDVKQLEVDVRGLKGDVKQLSKRFKKVERYSKDMADFLDRQNIDIEKRTERIEQHLGLPSLQ